MSYIKQEHPEYYMDSKNISSSNFGDGNSGDYNQQSTQSSQNLITAFLAKLWALVNDPSCDDLIAWDPSGASFHVYDQSRFAREILPRYFKHNNFASFIRQLNMYGFRKLSTIEQGSLKNERDDIEFAHPHFIRGQESLLESIKRRAPDNQQKSALQGGSYLDPKTGRPIELSHILTDVRNLQSKQTSLNDKLSYMQTENQALWGEIASLRQKHAKQQQIVSKLMEFLLQFITSNSAPNHEQSVEQQPPNEGLITDLLHSQHAQAQHHTLNQQDPSPNTLKRKHAALTHNDEPNKRTTMRQQQQQQQFSHPTGLGRQQSVTINELTDNDAGGWLHTNTSPLVDLVPSPPPTQTANDNYPQQQQNEYRWPAPTNEPGHNLRNPAFPTVGNGDNLNNPYVPDFILRTDSPSGTKIDGANLTTSHANTDNLKTSSTLYSQNQHQHKIGQAPGPLSFSLDDITGDVDHIQSSLDNIREFMFDNLPDEPTIDDLFGEENGLLSPLLHTTSVNNPTANLLQDQKLIPGDYKPSDQTESTKTFQSVPNVNDQLLEHLITESALVEEQRYTIDQLEREKSDLEDKIHLLEQQTTQKK